MYLTFANFVIGLQNHEETAIIAYFVTFYTLGLWEWLTLFEIVKYFNLLKSQTFYTRKTL